MKTQTREEWLKERKTYIGASDAASVINAGKWGCALKLYRDKTGSEKDFSDDDKQEFRRGKRLEGIAASYYEELTGRSVFFTARQHMPGKPHLAVSMDRQVFKKEDKDKKNPGYLEIKTLGRWSFSSVKKNGLPEDYVVQLQYGMGIAGVTWGAYAIYCPETDELLHWDVSADKHLGNALLEKADDFWALNIGCEIEPDRLPEGSKACETCVYKFSCWSGGVIPESAGKVNRPDLESWAQRFAEVKGMSSETSDAEEALKEEFLEAVNGVPGVYQCGRYEVPFTIAKQKRFSGELLKKSQPETYEKFRVETEVKTIRKPKEV